MNAMTHMADVLCALKKSPEQLRREKNRRYYANHRARWPFYGYIRRLKAMHQRIARKLLC